MKLILLFYLLIFGAFVGNAQTNAVIGRVTDTKTAQPLRDVRIYWKGKKEDMVRTDKFGVFQIPRTNDTEIIVFEYAGKKTKEEHINNASFNELNISLDDRGATAVTASRWEQSIYETPASVIVIGREEIERHGYLTVQEVLESVPGVFTIDHRSESDVTIGIRGFWGGFNRNVMIQVNGVNMLSERQNDYPLNKINVPVEAIDKIEIVRGPMSVIYGAGAFFGVINIITNDVGSGSQGQVTVSSGTQNNNRLSLNYRVDREGLKLSFNAATLQRDGFEQNWDDFTSADTYDADAAENARANRIGARTISFYRGETVNPERYSKKHQSLNLSLGYEGFGADVNYAASDFGFSFFHPGPLDRAFYKSSTLNTQFSYRGSSRSNDFDYQAKLIFMNSTVDANYQYYTDDVFPKSEDRVRSLRAELNVRKVFSDTRKGDKLDLDLIGGLWYNRNFINHSTYDAVEFDLVNWYVGLSPGTSLDTKAGYLQLNLKRKQLQVVLGGRLEQQNNYAVDNRFNVDFPGRTPVNLTDLVRTDDVNLIPRLALIYSLNKGNKGNQYLKLMYGKAIKQASAVDNAQDVLLPAFTRTPELFPDGTRPNTELRYLKPEQIKTLEFGYTLNHEPLGLEVNVNLFLNEAEDLVTRQIRLVGGVYSPSSTNGAGLTSKGIEFIGKKNFEIPLGTGKLLKLNTQTDITYQQTSNSIVENADEVAFSFAPSFSPSWLGNLKLTGAVGKLSFGMHLNYVGKMRAQVIASQGNNPDFTGDDVSEYYRFGMNLRLRNLSFFKQAPGNFFVNLRASNLFDKLYRYPTYSLNPWADRGVPGRARQVLLTLGYKF